MRDFSAVQVGFSTRKLFDFVKLVLQVCSKASNSNLFMNCGEKNIMKCEGTMWKNCRDRYIDYAYLVFRVLIGLAFMQHGLQKVFGLLGKTPAEPFSIYWLAGIVELIGGFLVIIGLFTIIAASANALLMLIAYWYAHAWPFWTTAISPIANRGELAVVYFAAFLVIAFIGGGKYSIDGRR